MLVGKIQQTIRPKQKDYGDLSQKKSPNVSPSLEFMSLEKSLNIKGPLKNNSSDLSFKGSFLYKDTGKYNLNEFFEFTDKHLGKMVRELYDELIKSDLSKNMISTKGNEVQLSKKTIPHLIGDGLKYPFHILPGDVVHGSVELLGHLKPFKSWADKTLNNKFFKGIAERSEFDTKINSLRGLFEFRENALNDALKAEKTKLGVETLTDAQKAKVEAEVNKNMEWLVFQRSMKMFDEKTGNYDTKHERALNRLVSGLPPAIFLANDAYNLSRMMDDDPSAAKHEKKTRFKQEVSRILMSGYLTLITMGALQKYINNSKLGIMMTVGGTVLATETYSRLRNGKHIKRLTPEEARAENARKKAPEADIKPDKGLTFKSGTQEQSKEKQQKPLLSLDTLLKASAAVIAGGFAIKGLRKIPRIDAMFEAAAKPFNKFFKDLTEISDYKIPIAKIEETAQTLKDHGFGLRAEQYLKVANRSRELVVEKVANTLNKSSDIGVINKFIDNITKKYTHPDTIRSSLKSLLNVLKDNGYDEICREYQYKMVGDLRNNASLISKLKEAVADLRNLGNANKGLVKAVLDNNLKKGDTKLLISVKNALGQKGEILFSDYEDALNGLVNLGTKDTKYKPWVVFLKTPFSFAWDVVKFPYKIVNQAVEIFTKKAPKSQKSMDALNMEAVSKSFDKISREAKKVRDAIASTSDEVQKQKYIKKFQNFITETTLKAFNVDNISNVSNSELSNLAKTVTAAATIWFLMTDNYNMVMLKSNGNDIEGAETKFKERFVQEGSRLFYQTLLIDLFNNTFRKQYNGSLFGMSWITLTNTTMGEFFTRSSVGVPIGEHTRKELLDHEEKMNNAEGFKKRYNDFMIRLTGKRSIKSYNVNPALTQAQTSEKMTVPPSMTGSNIFDKMIKG